MNRSCYAFSCFLLLSVLYILPAFSQQSDTVFQSKVFTFVPGSSMPYRLFMPKEHNAKKKFPLVLWLHGMAGRGNDNVKNISGGNEIGSHVWVQESNQKKFPCYVVAPQCPDTMFWVENDGVADPPDHLDRVVQLIHELTHTYNIDTNRIYVAGQSMGGVAVWEIIGRYPQLFAAALPLCGMGNTRNAPKLKETSIWAFHGVADATVPVERSREMVNAIKNAGGHPKLSEYEGVGHDVWTVAFKEPTLVPWVFAQKR